MDLREMGCVVAAGLKWIMQWSIVHVGVGNDHGVMSKTALCKLLMRKTGLCERDCLQTPPPIKTRKILMLIIYAVLAQLVLPVLWQLNSQPPTFMCMFLKFSVLGRIFSIYRGCQKYVNTFSERKKTVLKLQYSIYADNKKLIQVTIDFCNYKRCSKWLPSSSRHFWLRRTTAWATLTTVSTCIAAPFSLTVLPVAWWC